VAQLPSSRHLRILRHPSPRFRRSPVAHLHPRHPCYPRHANATFAVFAASLRCAWISARSRVASS